MAENEPTPQARPAYAVPDSGGGSGNYSNSAITTVGSGEPLPNSRDEQILAAKISRAMLSGPRHITRDATVADMDEQGNRVVLRPGTNDWVCFTADENEIGNVPMCADPNGLQWMNGLKAGKPASRHRQIPLPGSSTCSAAHRNTATRSFRQDQSCHSHWPALDDHLALRRGARRSAQHRARCRGLGDVRWNALRLSLHICGTPWAGNEYTPDQVRVWMMRYSPPTEPPGEYIPRR